MEKKFDLKVHHKDKKSGRMTSVNPYQMRHTADGGVRYYRKGVEFYPNGDPVNEDEYRKVFSVELEAKRKSADPSGESLKLHSDLMSLKEDLESKMLELDRKSEELGKREYELSVLEKSEELPVVEPEVLVVDEPGSSDSYDEELPNSETLQDI